jgi:hypothetical protein
LSKSAAQRLQPLHLLDHLNSFGDIACHLGE